MANQEDKRIRVVLGTPLEQDVLSMDGSMVLCRKGVIVTQELINKLSRWIVEEEPRMPGEKAEPRNRTNRAEILKRLDFEDIVSKQTREQLDKGAEDFFSHVGKRDSATALNAVEESIQQLVDQTPDNPDVPLKLFELKQHSTYVYQHSIECGVIASYVATNLNYPPREVSAFALAMMLHDTGILMVPTEILTRSVPLTPEDWAEIQKHPKMGFDVLKTVPGMDPLALLIAMGHHARADGSGYPVEADFNVLPPLAHLAALVDSFEALTAERPWRPAYSLFDAMRIIMNNRDRFHPGAHENFVRVVGLYPVSTFVTLNTAEIGVVVRNNPENLFLPEIKLVNDPAGKPYSKEIVVNLFQDPDRRIVRVEDTSTAAS